MGDKVRWPKEMRSNPNRRNPEHWCEFHNDHGHKTIDCRLLQGEVDHLLKQGYLTELFSERDINGVTYTAANKVSKVTIIHGKRVRHVLEEESITFDDADADDVLSPYNDALVISLLVHDTNVKRVLIDPGSTVNIILLRVLREMQAKHKLIPKVHALSGFDNSSVVTKRGGNTYYICRRSCQRFKVSGGRYGDDLQYDPWVTMDPRDGCRSVNLAPSY
ncbi:uncharacterized protein [Nicotiana sylvestris]|uniref:uncharacterized protein n=1 Tax=Nicotiana sylvestris TaxID=4096 RepID=UPI00388C6A39